MLNKLFAQIGFETKDQAHKHHNTLARITARQDSPPERLTRLANCSSDNRCHLDGCPLCGRRFRKSLLKAVKKLGLHKGVWARCCLILDGHVFPEGELAGVDLPRLTKAIHKRLERSAFRDAVIVGGWDISWNTFENVPEGWCLHLYLLINLPHSAALEKQVREAFKLSAEALRPFSVRPVTPRKRDFLRVVSYSNKIRFKWRSGYFEPRLKRDGAPRKDAGELPLKPAQHLELLSWLSQYPVGARLIMRNMKRLNPPWAKLRLKLLTPMTRARSP